MGGARVWRLAPPSPPADGPPPDEYGWMDDPAAAGRLQAHLRAESAYTAATLSPLDPDAAAFAARAASWFPSTEATVPEQVGGFLYWTEQRPGDAGPRLLRRPVDTQAREHPPTLVLDAGAVLAGLGDGSDLAAVKISPCGRLVAALAHAAGEGVAVVRAVASEGDGGGRSSSRPDLARLYGAAGLEWGAPGTGTLFFTSCPALDGRPAEVRAAVGLVGKAGGAVASTSAAADHPVLLTWPDSRDHLALGRSKDGAWLTATAVRRDAAVPHVLSLIVPPSSSSSSSSSPHPFTRVGSGTGEDGVETFVESDGRSGLLLLTNEAAGGAGGDGAPREEAWLGWAPHPAAPPSAWTPLLRRRPGTVVTDMDVFSGGGRGGGGGNGAGTATVLLYERNTACGTPGLSLLRLEAGRQAGAPPGAASHAAVALPRNRGGWACIRPGANADPAAATARVAASSPLAPPAAWDVDLVTGRVTAPPPPPETAAAAASVAASAAGLRLRRTAVTSSPGGGLPPARVPLTVVESCQRRGCATPAAALVVLYGAYGAVLEPDFDPLWLSLACEGWTIVLAGVRGGGERGRAWHAGGRGAARAAAAADAEAAVAWAAAGGGSNCQRRPVLVSAESAGGLLAGSLLLRGGLAGAILRAPFLDVCTHALGKGPLDPAQAALAAHEAGEWAAPGGGAAGLQAVCPYHRLGTEPGPPAFPPVLVTMGADDVRVPPAGVAKFVARWRAKAAGLASPSPPPPALLAVRDGEGHAGPLGVDALAVVGMEAAFAVAAVQGRL